MGGTDKVKLYAKEIWKVFLTLKKVFTSIISRFNADSVVMFW